MDYQELWHRLRNRLRGLRKAYSIQEQMLQNTVSATKAIGAALELMDELESEDGIRNGMGK